MIRVPLLHPKATENTCINGVWMQQIILITPRGTMPYLRGIIYQNSIHRLIAKNAQRIDYVSSELEQYIIEK
jgi:hypothetical protein